MNITELRVLRGPHVHGARPCVLATVSPPDPWPVDLDWSTVAERVRACLPDLSLTKPREDDEDGLDARRLLAPVAMGLQRAHNVQLRLHKTLPGKPPGKLSDKADWRIVCEYDVEAVARGALQAAVDIVRDVMAGRTPDMEAVRAGLQALQSRHGLEPGARAIVEAARDRGIPVMRLTEDSGLIQLGWGRRQRRIQGTMTDGTSHIAVSASRDKMLGRQLLRTVGIPVPDSRAAQSADEALRAAEALGGHLVIKPLGGRSGEGVMVDARRPDEIRQAWERASAASTDGKAVCVEKAVPGVSHRALIVGQRLVAVSRRSPPSVVGDGAHTVAQLIDAENEDPRRGEGRENVLTRIPVDDGTREMLALQGLSIDDVPLEGLRVPLRRDASLLTGGSAEDVTDLVHPDTAARCIEAACQIGLDVAGVDLVCRDIALPLDDQEGAILDVHAAPGIRMHEYPSQGPARRAGQAIVDMLFGAKGSAKASKGRVPLIAVTGTNGKTTTTLAIAHVLSAQGVRTGWSTTEGVFVQGRQIMPAPRLGDPAVQGPGHAAARALLADTSVEHIVAETSRADILHHGLAFDLCDVAVVLNISPDHLGQDGIETLEGIAEVKAVVAQAASRAVVLNAQDPLCVQMASRLRHRPEVIYFSRDPGHPVVREHVGQGGRALVLHHHALTVMTATSLWHLVDISELPAAFGGAAAHNVDNLLAAAAALIASDSPAAAIAQGLRQFQCSAAGNPLRMNFFRVGTVPVVVDHAHNEASYCALIETVRQLYPQHRLVGLVSVPGDRRNAEVKEVASLCAKGFDELVVYEPDETRGREPGDLARVFMQGVWMAGVPCPVIENRDVREALVQALQEAREDQVLVVGCAGHLQDLFLVAERLQLPVYEMKVVSPSGLALRSRQFG